MKRIFSVLVPLPLLTSIALTTRPEPLASQSPEAVSTDSRIEVEQATISEPVLIVISGVTILGWTTFLRRSRLNRRGA